ncbi:S8 family peptidase [Luteithermobacter gelatinilyticus]|uniref:S8 family peptidase n=1 Tax=Luteithermobacter gelatinilyticus TaxID=2582913 RepID=UPI001105C090|nr:S8 family peptidase [Luteithermobacter gelatinilyticus]
MKIVFQKGLMGLALSVIVSACGGGGGGMPGLSTPVVPPDNTGPTASPDPDIDYDTVEYRDNYGLDQIGAISAYEAGATGEGITVAVIDSGIDRDHPQIAANVHPQSTNIVTGNVADLEDVDGHGTGVAGVIAATRDDTRMHGVAFDASILALNTAETGSCESEDGCTFRDNDIASALDYARTHGAKVVNISLGGDTPNNFRLRSALQNAVAAGMVIVVSAGNIDEDTPPGAGDSPNPSASDAWAAWANGQIIVAGSVNENGELSSFSHRAGEEAKDVYLVAAGENIRTLYKDGEFALFDGTSFSAPHIAGAAALLFQAFPNLTGPEVAELLYTTATDLGAEGVDVIYGRGLVNLAAAFAPQGSTSVAVQTTEGAVVTFSTDQSQIYTGGAFGDLSGLGRAVANSMILDGYNRSFVMDLGTQVHRDEGSLSLQNVLDSRNQSREATLSLSPQASLNFYWREQIRFAEIDRRYFAHFNRPERSVADLRFSLAYQLGKGQKLSVAQGLSLTELTEDYRYDDYLALGKGDFLSLMPRDGSRAALFSLGQPAKTRLQIAAGQGRKDYAELNLETRHTILAVRLDRGVTKGVSVGFDMGALQEEGSVLGSLSDGALKIGDGATSVFGTLRLDVSLGGGVSLYGRYSAGLTNVDNAPASLIRAGGALRAQSFALGLRTGGLLQSGDSLTLGFRQPLRVETGSAEISYVANRDYENDVLNFATRAVTLSPSGRERDIELAYRMPAFWGAEMQINLLHQVNPGHQAGTAASSVLLRLGSRF